MSKFEPSDAVIASARQVNFAPLSIFLHINLAFLLSTTLEWLFEVGDPENDAAALAIDPAPRNISRDDPGAWFGDRTASILQLVMSLEDLRRHLKECLEGGYVDNLLQLSPSRFVFLVTKTHEVGSWATTVRLDSEQTMRLGIRFSQDTGACVGFGWYGRRERHSLPSLNRRNDSPAPKSAAFMSGFYIFARSDRLHQPASAQSIVTAVSSQGSFPSDASKLDTKAQSSSASPDTGSQPRTTVTGGSNVSSLQRDFVSSR